jgi:ParB family chromosome partitioning protein
MAIDRKKGLGRGLDAILADSGYQDDENGLKTLKIGDLEPNRSQPRKDFSQEELETLAESIKQYGVMSPIIVKKTVDGYRIIAGERRWRAARLAGLEEVPVIVKEVDDITASEMAIVENVQRTDLNPVEEASAYKTLIEEYDLTQEEIAEKIGKSRSYVANSIRLLDLPEVALDLLAQGKISTGHAKVLLGIKNTEKIYEVAKEVAEKELSVKETEVLVKRANNPKKEKKVVKDFDYTKALEDSIQRKLGRKVKINNAGRNKTISIGYSDNEDLEKLLKQLCGEDFIEKI